MTDRSIAAVCASVLFVIAVAIGVAGADRPPPPGFHLFVGVVGVLCFVAFVRIKAHLAARAAGRTGVGLRVGLEGMAAGISAVVALSLIGGGEPGVVVPLISRLIGVGAGALAGAAFAAMAWLAAVQLQVRAGRP